MQTWPGRLADSGDPRAACTLHDSSPEQCAIRRSSYLRSMCAATSSDGTTMVSRKRAEQPGEAVQDIISNPPLVPLTNQYLEDLSRRIQSKPVPWEGYARAELVSQDELRMIRSLDGKDDEEVSTILSKDNAALGDKYAHLYIRLLNKLTRTDTLQQILVLMGNLLKNHDERVESFLNVKSADNKSAWPWQPLVQYVFPFYEKLVSYHS